MTNYSKAKGRATYSSFFGLPKEVIAHTNFISLTSAAIKLLVDLGFQYNGKNNGDLCAAFSLMSKRGWKSKETLWNAIDCAINYRMIMVTRQGGKHQATLYAFTWRSIDECQGKLDVNATLTPPGTWKEKRPKWGPKSKRNKKNTVPRKSGQSGMKSVLINQKTGERWRILSRKSYQYQPVFLFSRPDNHTAL